MWKLLCPGHVQLRFAGSLVRIPLFGDREMPLGWTETANSPFQVLLLYGWRIWSCYLGLPCIANSIDRRGAADSTSISFRGGSGQEVRLGNHGSSRSPGCEGDLRRRPFAFLKGPRLIQDKGLAQTCRCWACLLSGPRTSQKLRCLRHPGIDFHPRWRARKRT
jgi:hypothetical protein